MIAASFFCFLNSQVYTLAGIDESGTVVTVGILRAVLIFVETAAWPVRASMQAPGERSRLEQRKGRYSGQSGVQCRPKTQER